MTYAYVAPFFVSAAFQMVTQAQRGKHTHTHTHTQHTQHTHTHIYICICICHMYMCICIYAYVCIYIYISRPQLSLRRHSSSRSMIAIQPLHGHSHLLHRAHTVRVPCVGILSIDD